MHLTKMPSVSKMKDMLLCYKTGMSAVQIYIYKHRGKQNQRIDFNQWCAKIKHFYTSISILNKMKTNYCCLKCCCIVKGY